MTKKHEYDRVRAENIDLKAKLTALENENRSLSKYLASQQMMHLNLAKKNIKNRTKLDAIAYIISSMYYGRTPSDSVSFCEIFGLIKKDCPDACAECIKNYILECIAEENPVSAEPIQKEPAKPQPKDPLIDSIVMARHTDKSLGLTQGKYYTAHGFTRNPFTIVIENDEGEICKIPADAFI